MGVIFDMEAAHLIYGMNGMVCGTFIAWYDDLWRSQRKVLLQFERKSKWTFFSTFK